MAAVGALAIVAMVATTSATRCRAQIVVGPESAIGAPGVRPATVPAVALASNGRAYLGLWSPDPTWTETHATRIDAAGVTLDRPPHVVASFYAGDPIWSGTRWLLAHRASDAIELVGVAESTTGLEPATRVSLPGAPGPYALACGRDGRCYLALAENVPPTIGVRALGVDARRTVAPTTATQLEGHGTLRAAVTEDGVLLVRLGDRIEGGVVTGQVLEALWLDRDGTPRGDPFPLRPLVDRRAYDVTAAAQGSAVLVAYRLASSLVGSEDDVVALVVAPSGTSSEIVLASALGGLDPILVAPFREGWASVLRADRATTARFVGADGAVSASVSLPGVEGPLGLACIETSCALGAGGTVGSPARVVTFDDMHVIGQASLAYEPFTTAAPVAVASGQQLLVGYREDERTRLASLRLADALPDRIEGSETDRSLVLSNGIDVLVATADGLAITDGASVSPVVGPLVGAPARADVGSSAFVVGWSFRPDLGPPAGVAFVSRGELDWSAHIVDVPDVAEGWVEDVAATRTGAALLGGSHDTSLVWLRPDGSASGSRPAFPAPVRVACDGPRCLLATATGLEAAWQRSDEGAETLGPSRSTPWTGALVDVVVVGNSFFLVLSEQGGLYGAEIDAEGALVTPPTMLGRGTHARVGVLDARRAVLAYERGVSAYVRPVHIGAVPPATASCTCAVERGVLGRSAAVLGLALAMLAQLRTRASRSRRTGISAREGGC